MIREVSIESSVKGTTKDERFLCAGVRRLEDCISTSAAECWFGLLVLWTTTCLPFGIESDPCLSFMDG